MLVGVVDYKMGNLASVKSAIDKIGYRSKIVKTKEEIELCDKLILPGVGAFPDAISHLREFDLIDSIKDFAKSGKNLLGICLGMQLLFSKSFEFEECEGLGLIEGEVVPFCRDRISKEHKIPQMGWNAILKKRDCMLFDRVKELPYLYFVHSYHVVTSEQNIVGTTIYGYEFASVVKNGNVYGIQPHPEKSHDVGLLMLENFLKG